MNEERFARIEEELTRLRRRSRLGWGAAALMGLTLLIGATRGSGSLTAERFELIDANGDVRAVLGSDGVNPSLTLFDSRGANATLSLTAGMPVLSLVSETSTVTLGPKGRPDAVAVAKEVATSPKTAPRKAEKDPPAEGGTLTVKLATDTLFTAIEVICPDGYRQRGSFAGGVASVDGVPTTLPCDVLFKGSIPTQVSARGGDNLTCSMDGNQAICH